MIKVEIVIEDKDIQSFKVSGHAFTKGNSQFDMVCAGVSAVVVGGFNALENLKEEFQAEVKDGLAKVVSLKEISENNRIILNTILIQLKSIAESYPKNIQINIKKG